MVGAFPSLFEIYRIKGMVVIGLDEMSYSPVTYRPVPGVPALTHEVPVTVAGMEPS
jgi:hypothetical protein